MQQFTFLTDPKYSYIRHAAITGVAVFIVGMLQATSQTDWGSWTPWVTIIAAGIIGQLKGYISTPTV